MEDNKERNEIYSKRVRAGKRTYFFDVRATKSNDHYLTITESKRKFKEGEEGFTYEKHKIFLYKEDFEKFTKTLENIMDRIENQNFERSPEDEENRPSSDELTWD